MLQFSPALPISGPGARHASALDLFPLPDLVRLLGTMWPTDRLEGWQPSLAEAPGAGTAARRPSCGSPGTRERHRRGGAARPGQGRRACGARARLKGDALRDQVRNRLAERYGTTTATAAREIRHRRGVAQAVPRG